MFPPVGQNLRQGRLITRRAPCLSVREIVPALLVGWLVGVPVAAQPPQPSTGFHEEETVVYAHDDVALASTLWIPNAPGPHPAVLVAHGFGGSREDVRDAAEHLAEQGYVALAWDARGFGQSGGLVGLNGPSEVRDVSTLVTYLARRPEVRLDARDDPRVGMWGSSYGGAIQLLASAHDPRIDALTPRITWNWLEYSLSPNGVLKTGWIVIFYTVGTAAGHGATTGNPNAGGLDPKLTQYFVEAMATNQLSAAAASDLRERSPRTFLEQVRAPALLLQGWQDSLFNANEAAWTYRQLVGQGTPANLAFFDGGHGAPTKSGVEDLLTNRTDDWFRFWLRGEGSGETLVETPVAWVGGDAPVEFSWPSRDLQSTPYYFAGDGTTQGRLGPVPPAEASRALLGVGGIASYSALPELQRFVPGSRADPPATSVTFRTDPLASPVRFFGEARIVLWVATTADAAPLFVKIYDEAPDGSAVLLDDQVSPVRVVGPDVSLASPRPYEVPLVALHHTFEAGHRIRLTFSTSDLLYGSGRTAGVVALFQDPERPSLLVFPAIPGDRYTDRDPPTIRAVLAQGANAVEAQIVDARGVAAAHLLWRSADGAGISVGLNGSSDAYGFRLGFPTPTRIQFHVVAYDAAGNLARSGEQEAFVGPSAPQPRGAPGPSLAAALWVLALAGLWEARRDRATDTLMRRRP